jgi:hypothetical protein
MDSVEADSWKKATLAWQHVLSRYWNISRGTPTRTINTTRKKKMLDD